MLRVRVAASLVCALGVATAAPAPHALRWERATGAERCIDGETLRAAVERSLGHALARGTASVRTIEGRVTRDGDGFRATLVVRDEAGASLGERVLHEAGDCRALDEPLVLVISLIVDPDARVGDRVVVEPVTPPPAPPSPPAIGTPSASVAERSEGESASVAERSVGESSSVVGESRPGVSASSPGRPIHATAGGGVVAAGGFLPGFAAGLRVEVELDASTLPALSMSLTGWLPDEARIASGGTELLAASAGVAACPALARWSSTIWRACVGLEASAIRATGVDLAVSRTQVEWLASGRADLELAIQLGRWNEIAVAAGLGVPMVRPRFVLTDGDAVREIYRLPAVHGLGRTAWRIRF